MKKVLAILITLILTTSLVACGGEKIVWDDLILGEFLPKPTSTKGEIRTNSAEELSFDISNVSDKEYNDYIETCKEKGFNIDSKTSSYSYEAYNKKGYKLNLSHYGNDKEMRIQLNAPMEMSTIAWPTSTAGNKIPAPKSTIGKFSYEYDDNFLVYIGDTTKEDYTEYVKICSEKGFNIDYSKDDYYYYADNSEGWHIAINYVGNNIIRIEIDSPDDDSDNSSDSSNEDVSDDINSDFKEAMDSYEEFINEYVDFMKKYKKNPNDISLIKNYADYMSRYAEFASDFSDWENEDLSTAEATYYIEVQSRVSKKMLEIAN